MPKGMIQFALSSLHLTNPDKKGFRVSEIRNYLDQQGILTPSGSRAKDLTKVTEKIRKMFHNPLCPIGRHPESRVNQFSERVSRIYFLIEK